MHFDISMPNFVFCWSTLDDGLKLKLVTHVSRIECEYFELPSLKVTQSKISLSDCHLKPPMSKLSDKGFEYSWARWAVTDDLFSDGNDIKVHIYPGRCLKLIQMGPWLNGKLN